jgi:hypothetical protein
MQEKQAFPAMVHDHRSFPVRLTSGKPRGAVRKFHVTLAVRAVSTE